MQTPTVGRIVHYWTHEPAQGGGVRLVARAAIVTEVAGNMRVHLTVLFPHCDLTCFSDVEHSVDPAYGRWSWPERVT